MCVAAAASLVRVTYMLADYLYLVFFGRPREGVFHATLPHRQFSKDEAFIQEFLLAVDT